MNNNSNDNRNATLSTTPVEKFVGDHVVVESVTLNLDQLHLCVSRIIPLTGKDPAALDIELKQGERDLADYITLNDENQLDNLINLLVLYRDNWKGGKHGRNARKR